MVMYDKETVAELLKLVEGEGGLSGASGVSGPSPFLGMMEERPLEPPSPGYEGVSWERLKKVVGPVEWDWAGWLPSGFLTVLAAEPGMGKSLLCLRIAASYIEGKPLPDGTPFSGERGRVVWCEGEGSQALNMARAEAWGLNLSKLVSPLPDAFTGFRMDDQQHMLNLLMVCKDPNVRLVVMDSLTSLVLGGRSASGVRSDSIQGIPRAMQQLREFGRFLRRPILLTHHLRKRTTVDRDGFINLERIRGTSKIAQMARVIWTLDTPNEGDRAHRRLAVAKNNLMTLPEPLGMRIDENGPVFGEPPMVVTGRERARVIDEAADFLVEFLGDGVVAASEVLEAGKAAGFSRMALKRAKRLAGVKSRKVGNGWGWELINN